MRARNIKPGFFKNEELAECEPFARILFEGLWCYCDREGRFEWRPKRIKAEILPYDEKCNVMSLLCQLFDRKLIVKYSANGKEYGFIPSFLDHNNPHPHEAKSKIPPFSQEFQCHDMQVTSNGHVDDLLGASQAESLNPSSLNPESLLMNPSSQDLVEQESATESEKPKKPLKKKNDPNIKKFINYYHNTFLERFNEKPMIDGGKDGKIIKTLLGTYNLEILKEFLDRFFSSTDPFILQGGYTIGVFKSQINKLIAGLKVDPKTATRFLTIKQWEPKNEE